MFNYPVPHGRYALTEAGYAVIDLETTGFNAEGPDRIVEVAIVRIDASGRELGTFQTLVDPGRSPGPSAVHGITRDMLRRAPTFAEIAGSVLAWLRGVVVVAHNAQFEDAFLSAEFARTGLTVPSLPALDTLRVAQAWLPTRNHNLTTVCKWAGIEIEGAHTALGDASATARMLPKLMALERGQPRWRDGFPAVEARLGTSYLPRQHAGRTTLGVAG